MRLNRFSLMSGLAALALSATGCGESKPAAALPAEGVIRLSDKFTSDFVLIDQDGRVTKDEDFKGKVALVYFGFASCPDVCPMALGRMSAALNVLTDKERDKVAAIFITVDPERDTPEVIKSFLSFDPRIIGLTGDTAAVDAARTGFRVYAEQVPVPDPKMRYTMEHSSYFYLVEKSGALNYALQDTLTPDQIVTAIRNAF